MLKLAPLASLVILATHISAVPIYGQCTFNFIDHTRLNYLTLLPRRRWYWLDWRSKQINSTYQLHPDTHANVAFRPPVNAILLFIYP